ncbi:hypothetical protein [Streptomyces sp. NPDC048516]|uniref:hypothetical protein n=1 Tax=Streptomyces sp. NPDC048516 TaxID=3365565 RepID=UPI0037112CDE
MAQPRAIVLTMAAGTLALGTALPADASDRDTQATTQPVVSRQAHVKSRIDFVRVPKCAKKGAKLKTSGYTDHLWMKNHCGHSVKVKVILHSHRDFGCKKLPKGGSHWWSWSWPAKLDKVVKC